MRWWHGAFKPPSLCLLTQRHAQPRPQRRGEERAAVCQGHQAPRQGRAGPRPCVLLAEWGLRISELTSPSAGGSRCGWGAGLGGSQEGLGCWVGGSLRAAWPSLRPPTARARHPELPTGGPGWVLALGSGAGKSTGLGVQRLCSHPDTAAPHHGLWGRFLPSEPQFPHHSSGRSDTWLQEAHESWAGLPKRWGNPRQIVPGDLCPMPLEPPRCVRACLTWTPRRPGPASSTVLPPGAGLSHLVLAVPAT